MDKDIFDFDYELNKFLKDSFNYMNYYSWEKQGCKSLEYLEDRILYEEDPAIIDLCFSMMCRICRQSCQEGVGKLLVICQSMLKSNNIEKRKCVNTVAEYINLRKNVFSRFVTIHEIDKLLEESKQE